MAFWQGHKKKPKGIFLTIHDKSLRTRNLERDKNTSLEKNGISNGNFGQNR
jgi:hypothetical protein